MSRREVQSAANQLSLHVLAVAGAAMLALPSASLALATLNSGDAPQASTPLDLFTPASVDPELAARIADQARAKGLRFTPAASNPSLRERTVTVAVRVDEETAKAISVRNAAAAPGAGEGISALNISRFDLGTARGYQSFARPVVLPASVSDLKMPDLSEFKPDGPKAQEEPGRLQPRIGLEDNRLAGRSTNTLDDLGAQTFDLGGSFRIASGFDVTAGVRLSQERERERLRPLTNSEQDSQAVYVGTQIKF